MLQAEVPQVAGLIAGTPEVLACHRVTGEDSYSAISAPAQLPDARRARWRR